MNIRRKFLAQFILITIFIFFIVYTLIANFIFQVKKLNEYKAEISSLNDQISSTKQEIEDLKKIENGSTSENLETIARNRLNMVKPNEIVYIDIGKEGN
ncbi:MULTISPECIES: FtsB family cell division protein [Romboutsia]|jgi:cell division protein DivIC|uniref:Septum formation initiator n=1 Tax=Romboutsia ilealis TaxID=1115758 RepID=A0A1V1HY22_9FIRM|nr:MULTISPECIES: septum formation initiator family protein [Romboutsia]MCI9061345.1 septation ring formation regulator EzrA [Romboutsia sp.]CED92799.1 Septum formation initiator [Romboutsia ilealis]